MSSSLCPYVQQRFVGDEFLNVVLCSFDSFAESKSESLQFSINVEKIVLNLVGKKVKLIKIIFFQIIILNNTNIK